MNVVEKMKLYFRLNEFKSLRWDYIFSWKKLRDVEHSISKQHNVNEIVEILCQLVKTESLNEIVLLTVDIIVQFYIFSIFPKLTCTFRYDYINWIFLQSKNGHYY